MVNAENILSEPLAIRELLKEFFWSTELGGIIDWQCNQLLLIAIHPLKLVRVALI
jgi:hypothetical protein